LDAAYRAKTKRQISASERIVIDSLPKLPLFKQLYQNRWVNKNFYLDNTTNEVSQAKSTLNSLAFCETDYLKVIDKASNYKIDTRMFVYNVCLLPKRIALRRTFYIKVQI